MKITFLTFIFCLSTALANNVEADALFLACLKLVGPYKYACDGRTLVLPGYVASPCNCYSSAFQAGYVDCINRAKNGNRKRALNSLVTSCAESSSRQDLTSDYLNQIYSNQTDNFIDSTSYSNQTEISSPLRFSQEKIDLYFRSYRSKTYSTYSSQLYGGLMNAYFAALFAITTISNFLRRCTPGFVQSMSRYRLVLWVRQHIANPALISYKHNVPLKWGPINMSLPTRAQGWVLTGYLIMFIIFMFIKYDVFEGNVTYSTKRIQLLRVVSERSGIIAVSQFPLLFTFAGRNNVLLWVTGLSYDTMNLYHRWVARLMTTSAFIHVICFTLYFQSKHYYPAIFHVRYIRFGAAAITAACLLMFFSLRHFREHLYEVFLAFHWALVIAFTATIWHHLTKAGHIEWLYAAVAVWAFDRAVRIAKVVLNGLVTHCNAELHTQNLIKVKVKYTNYWRPMPGSYVFVHFLRMWGFWESHPFSIYPSYVEGEEDVLVLCMRVRGGKTQKIKQYFEQQPNGMTRIPLLVDGPYGHAFPIQNSESMVFISGGIGFTAMYSYACNLKHHGEKKQITFIWAIRNYENTETFREELAYLTDNGQINVILYLTNETDSSQSSLNIHEKKNTDISDDEINEKIWEINHQNFQIKYGRPDIEAIISTSIDQAPGSIGIAVCGPERMNDDVRFYGNKYMGKGSGRVDIYTEAFNW